MLNSQEFFALINLANTQSGLLSENLVLSEEEFSSYCDIFKGVPILIPANDKLFTYDNSDTFLLSPQIILRTIYDQQNSEYVGFKHTFKSFSFLKQFKLNKKYNDILESIVKQNRFTFTKIAELKQKFNCLGAFQTRNIPHLGHERILNDMLEYCDHVVINPVIGPKKNGDITIDCLEHVFNFLKETDRFRSKISFLPIYANMFYAGPREAVHHIKIREKLGFEYFSIGRDHAGANNAYDPAAAQKLINRNRTKFKINVIAHNGAAFCKECDRVIIVGECNHDRSLLNDISGCEFRKNIFQKTIFEFADKKLQLNLNETSLKIFEK